MTVDQLIKELQKLPQDLVVLTYDNEWSEYDEVDSPKVVSVSKKYLHTRYFDGYKYTAWDSTYARKKGEQIQGVVLQ